MIEREKFTKCGSLCHCGEPLKHSKRTFDRHYRHKHNEVGFVMDDPCPNDSRTELVTVWGEVITRTEHKQFPTEKNFG
jgi:hypothetical protein